MVCLALGCAEQQHWRGSRKKAEQLLKAKGAEAGAVFEQRIVGTELSGDLEQGQAEQGDGGGFDQAPVRRNCQAGSSSCNGNRAGATSEPKSANSTSATTLRPGAERSTEVPEREESELGGMAELRAELREGNHRSRRP